MNQTKNKQKTNKNITLFSIVLTLALFAMPIVSASLVLDRIQFDPAIITAGDEVDIIIQYHDDSNSENDNKIGNSEYNFRTWIKQDDTVSEDYVLILDSDGDNLYGTVYAGEQYNKKFRIKVLSNAPSGTYEMKLLGQWYKEEIPFGTMMSVKFNIDVKKEGIILNIASLETVPNEIRPGDNYAKIVTRIENVGSKDAKAIELDVTTPTGITASYSNDNRVWIGRLNAGESKEFNTFIDVEENTTPGLYYVKYDYEYSDLDDNKYTKDQLIPLRIKESPYLEVVDVKGEGAAGTKTKLYVTVKNTGTESAELVDVRIMKQSVQPFSVDVRSDYIGELAPGEEGVAVFDINILSEAAVKEHDLKILIRAKGDTDEGDDNIYTFSRNATINVTPAKNTKLIYAIAIVVVALIAAVIYAMTKKRKR
ncbi:MAG: COG1361 S-layer family protein [Candidatus Woesearchaeota archaeon]